jgi:hypothetical protein
MHQAHEPRLFSALEIAGFQATKYLNEFKRVT